MVKILDCTLRDGGYYNDWNFTDEIIESYVNGMNRLPIEYLEIGYRNLPSKDYLGKLGYSPIFLLENIRNKSNKKIAIMLNEKSTKLNDLKELTEPIRGVVDMIRIAVDPQNMRRALILAQALKSQGFEVGFNLMYMSQWGKYSDINELLKEAGEVVDIVNMVDSFGGIMPDEIQSTVSKLKNILNCKIGFHGHNNLEMALANSMRAIECGVDYVDCTILGMGRGAGNLKTELLLTVLNSHGWSVDFNVLSDVISTFLPLQKKYQWGTQLPYMISGAYSLPQKEVMELVTNRIYSFESIVRGLQNKKNNIEDNAKYPVLKTRSYKNVIVIGGGDNVKIHSRGIKEYINKNKDIALVFASSRHASIFSEIKVPKFYCLIGNEAKRLKVSIDDDEFTDICILPPYPRKLGTEVPDFAENQTFELSKIVFTDQFIDSCTTLAIQTAINLSKGRIFMAGYDGYAGNIVAEKEISLSNENKILLQAYEKYTNKKMESLTPSLYQELDVKSVYQFL